MRHKHIAVIKAGLTNARNNNATAAEQDKDNILEDQAELKTLIASSLI